MSEWLEELIENVDKRKELIEITRNSIKGIFDDYEKQLRDDCNSINEKVYSGETLTISRPHPEKIIVSNDVQKYISELRMNWDTLRLEIMTLYEVIELYPFLISTELVGFENHIEIGSPFNVSRLVFEDLVNNEFGIS